MLFSTSLTRSDNYWLVSTEVGKKDGFLRAEVGEEDQLGPPVQGWQFKDGTNWSYDETLECSREVEEIIKREEERIKNEKEERIKKAAEVDAAAARGDLARMKELQQMDTSGDLSLSSLHHPPHAISTIKSTIIQ